MKATEQKKKRKKICEAKEWDKGTKRGRGWCGEVLRLGEVVGVRR